MLSITLWALLRIAAASFASGKTVNAVAACLLVGLALFVVFSALKRWRIVRAEV